MEARNVELALFSKRAADYKRAISLVPDARGLEINAVVAMVRGVVEERRWSMQRVRIVDLMAGNGALTRALIDAGFSKVIPVEACIEMHPADSDGLGFINGDAFNDLRSTMRQLQPDIIVTLAAMHHLIVYSDSVTAKSATRRLDHEASLAYQCEVIDACVQALTDHGALLVVDICELKHLRGLNIDPVKSWSRIVNVPGMVSDEERERIRQVASVEEYGEVLEQTFGRVEKNCPVYWFRSIVHKYSVVGHRDMAVSGALLRLLLLQYHTVRASLFACPWVFSSSDEAWQFVLHKFGFLVDRNPNPNAAEIERGMKRILGADSDSSGRTTIRWGLIAIAIRRRPRPRDLGARDSVAILNVVLGVALVCMIIQICARLSYSSDSIDGILTNAFWLLMGAGAGIALDLFKGHLVSRKRQE